MLNFTRYLAYLEYVHRALLVQFTSFIMHRVYTAVRTSCVHHNIFYYHYVCGRLSVDRPGRYTVRLTMLFYHNDKRRGDGIVLGLEGLIEVSPNTLAQGQRPPAKAPKHVVAVADRPTDGGIFCTDPLTRLAPC